MAARAIRGTNRTNRTNTTSRNSRTKKKNNNRTSNLQEKDMDKLRDQITYLLNEYAEEEYMVFNAQQPHIRTAEVNDFLSKYSNLPDDAIAKFFNEIIPSF